MTAAFFRVLFSVLFMGFTIVSSLSEGEQEQQDTTTQRQSVVSWLVIIAAISSILVTIGVAYIFFPAIVAAYGPRVRFEEQRLGKDAGSSNDNSNDSDDDERPLLSLVIPAYNEELRLETMLQEAYDYLAQTGHAPTHANSSAACPALQQLLLASSKERIKDAKNNRIIVEWIVVNDGSTDATAQVYEAFIQKIQSSSTSLSSTTTDGKQQQEIQMQWKLINLLQNSGKGAAVQAGMLAAACSKNKGTPTTSSKNSPPCFCLMVDADGATEFGTGLERLAQSAAAAPTTAGHDVVHFILGSRAQERNDSNDSSDGSGGVQRTLVRRFFQSLFHAFVVLLVGTSDVQDTQCGFKLFQGSVVPDLFQELHLRRWAFDTELLVRAKYLRLQIKEVVVLWHEVEGSKLNTSALNLIRVAIGMLRDMICVRLCYSLQIWKVKTPTSTSNTNTTTTTTTARQQQERKEQ